MFIDLKIDNKEIERVESIEVTASVLVPLSRAKAVIAPLGTADTTLFKRGAEAVVRYGHLDGRSRVYNGEIDTVSYKENNKIEINIVHKGIKLYRTLITESYNDETALTVIKRILQNAGFSSYKLSIPDILIPHIIFSNTTINKAIEKIICTVSELSVAKQIYYWVDDEDTAFYMVSSFEMNRKQHNFTTGENIITHLSSENDLSKITTELEELVKPAEIANIQDIRKRVNKKAYIISVTHSINKGIGRSEVYYK